MVLLSTQAHRFAQLPLIWAAVACSGQEASRGPHFGLGLRGLLDWLVYVHKCAGPLPTLIAAPPSLSENETCALVEAAKQRLARERPNVPNWDPVDTSRIVRAGVYQMVENQVDPAGRAPKDSSGFSVSATDTLLSVELDVPGRPRLVRVIYRGNTHHEEFGVVHRGPL